jgi:DNA-binding NarL/FixJ family response regulator
MKILVVDDHSLIREALRGALKDLEDEVAVLEASDSRQTLELAEQHADLDLILLDLVLPDRDGFSLLAELRKRYPAVAVVVLSAMDQRSNVIRALDLGVLGFIPKNASREIMLRALQLVRSGGVYIPPQILLNERPAPPPPMLNGRAAPTATSPEDIGLTGRQLDVLELMMQGKSNKAIGRALDLAEPTVKNHVTAIMKALKVTNRTEAVIVAGELGWELPGIAKS